MIEVLMEPDGKFRDLQREVLRLAEEVFREEYIAGVKVVGFVYKVEDREALEALVRAGIPEREVGKATALTYPTYMHEWAVATMPYEERYTLLDNAISLWHELTHHVIYASGGVNDVARALLEDVSKLKELVAKVRGREELFRKLVRTTRFYVNELIAYYTSLVYFASLSKKPCIDASDLQHVFGMHRYYHAFAYDLYDIAVKELGMSEDWFYELDRKLYGGPYTETTKAIHEWFAKVVKTYPRDELLTKRDEYPVLVNAWREKLFDYARAVIPEGFDIPCLDEALAILTPEEQKKFWEVFVP